MEKNTNPNEFAEVDVLWTNGKIERHVTIDVTKSSETISDNGSPCDIPTCRAFICVKLNGSDVRVQLLGSGIRIRRVLSDSKASQKPAVKPRGRMHDHGNIA